MIRLLQRALRAMFMAAEAVFNRAFGDRLNPLYHLGSISFFLFWVVGATGIVLYAFFDTSVSGAWRSVQAITEGGFGLGSAMRTAHRHATDAMLLTMLLHLVRHFAFDHLRGFRWFSWVTGVVLLWLAYIAGANGYMLPWDRMAQFVTQTSFEWLDWLPGFGGTLIRNFIAPEHVNDRLFSLLVFIHIGVPLGMLLLLWVHVQRVPKATTQPPRPIALALLAMLLVLAVLAPVASDRPADLHSVPMTLSLDWFVLPIFTLVHQWSPRTVWWLRRHDAGAAGAAVAAAAACWRPPQVTMHLALLRAWPRAAARLLCSKRPARRRGAALRLPRRRLRPVRVHRSTARSTSAPTSRSADRADGAPAARR
ncbi:MAG: cytochrome b N-terminal domain-containing protein [Rubrivivax sp.]